MLFMLNINHTEKYKADIKRIYFSKLLAEINKKMF